MEKNSIAGYSPAIIETGTWIPTLDSAEREVELGYSWIDELYQDYGGEG